ncbi:hypothetical protein CAOG_05296 [Capsaspora owczarzaki ATCC 30864]|uniref:Calcineurin-like phosphoesterase domain-containing protein n=1 Tax=Capsaspora owczarzaki (strain ATCC 30864) TaxID=595528 RepID=A0A0D2WT19_CAPO3|nr:hypothetical protein CAOG_05296 [Capsaspora owczarzaki ATCC 30864]KJE94693.1 hypothetical protein CAOG_005296 [Capsaspora owczarzaki ATCC 30864]|eukprot:XP_004346981.1 hypothetical protein CAOG_05296 [Capsaspora owczarzaki ATCC 30864]
MLGERRRLRAVLLAQLLAVVVMLATLAPLAHAGGLTTGAKPPLRFHADGSFKICQFADLHFGEGEDVTWGPVQDTNSSRVMRNVLERERPDLVVFSGDQITGNNVADNATAYWAQVVRECQVMGIPWAIIFGNHDDLASGVNGSRAALMEFDTSFELSYSQFGPEGLPGTSNYYLPLLASDSDQVASWIFFLDSGGGSIDEVITLPQVAWYRNTSASLEALVGRVLPSMAFFHIPLVQYDAVYSPEKCIGMNDDGITPQDEDLGIFQAFLDRGDVQLTSVGHDHGESFCCPLQTLTLCFGRHSGYGGYGDWDRGGRIFILSEPSKTTTQLSFSTYVRMENGTITDGPNFPKRT